MYGWHMCLLIVLNILFNLYFVFYFGGKGISLVYLKYSKRIKRYFDNKFNPPIDLSDISDLEMTDINLNTIKHVQGFLMEEGVLPIRRKHIALKIKKQSDLEEVKEDPLEEISESKEVLK